MENLYEVTFHSNDDDPDSEINACVVLKRYIRVSKTLTCATWDSTDSFRVFAGTTQTQQQATQRWANGWFDLQILK